MSLHPTLGAIKCASATVDGCSASLSSSSLSVVPGCFLSDLSQVKALRGRGGGGGRHGVEGPEVTVISASGLEKVRDYFKMNPYVVASLSGDERHSNEQRTPAHRDGGTSPRWDHALADPFTVDVAAARAGRLTLKLKIKTERTLRGDKDVGWVDVPVGELLDQGGDGETRAMSYAVRLPRSGSTGATCSSRTGSPTRYQPPVNQQPPMAGGGSVGGHIIGDVIPGVISNAVWSAMSN
ncbi:hypothetical protein NL676_030823 [Syzygium grande]|nr:hypothetical protein NL676_030823 [Syzygium grande]